MGRRSVLGQVVCHVLHQVGQDNLLAGGPGPHECGCLQVRQFVNFIFNKYYIFNLRCFTNATPHLLAFLAESPMVLCGIIPTWWLQDHMAEILLERPDGTYGWSSKLGRSLTVPELRTLLILRFEVGINNGLFI